MSTTLSLTKDRGRVTLILGILVLLLSLFTATSAMAATGDDEIRQAVRASVSGNDYSLAAGGSIKGSAVFDTQNNLDPNVFSTLDKGSQSQLVSDITSVATDAAEPSTKTVEGVSVNNVNGNVLQAYYKQLQDTPGVGSKMLSEIMKNTKPDFVTANKIYEPWSEPIGVVIALIVILLFAFFSIVIVLDISYIALPPFRMLVGDDGRGDGDGKKSFKSRLVSNPAIKAVQEAENDGEGGKQALFIYFKKQAVAMFALGFIVVVMVSGNLWTLIGFVLDMLPG